MTSRNKEIRMNTARHVLRAALISSALLLAACANNPDHARVAGVSTLAGTGVAGIADGKGAESQLNRPHGIGFLADGRLVVADRGNHLVRTIDTDGATHTLAGGGKAGFVDGAGGEALFNEPIAVVADRQGNVFVADRNNHRIRRIWPDGHVTTLAGSGEAGLRDGPAHTARFNQPYGVALDEAEVTLYVADYLNHSIRQINLLSDEVSTLAGNGKAGFTDGAGEKAAFNQPYNLRNDGHGGLIVPDQNNHAIRRVGMDGTVTTLAGSGKPGFADGKGSGASFNNPTGAVAAPDGYVYVADRNNHRLRRIAADGAVSSLAGSGEASFADGSLVTAGFDRPLDVVARDGTLFVSEENNHRIRVIAP